MRRLFPLLALGLAACATTPPPSQGPKTTQPPQQQPQRGGLIGLNQAELTTRFGTPSFQVREGPGLKLQWQNQACVLDAYLYPPERGTGAPTTLHVDTRRPGSGETVPPEPCLAQLTLQR